MAVQARAAAGRGSLPLYRRAEGRAGGRASALGCAILLHPTARTLAPQIGAVVCGVDPGLSYYKVAYAALCLQHNPGCLFIATNLDARGHFIAKQE